MEPRWQFRTNANPEMKFVCSIYSASTLSLLFKLRNKKISFFFHQICMNEWNVVICTNAPDVVMGGHATTDSIYFFNTCKLRYYNCILLFYNCNYNSYTWFDCVTFTKYCRNRLSFSLKYWLNALFKITSNNLKNGELEVKIIWIYKILKFKF